MVLSTIARRQTIARTLGDLVVKGTATSGTTKTIVDTNKLIYGKDDQLKGYEVYVHTGTNAGESRIINASESADKSITFAAMTSACDNTTQYEIYRKRRYQDYADALTLAEDAASEAIGQDRFDYYTPLVDETLIVNDLMMGAGQMERWASGVAVAPDDWTLDTNSAVARESAIVNKDLYSAKVTDDGSNEGYLQWQFARYLKYASGSFTLKARCRAGAATRARLQLYDGVTTTNSDYHSGSGGFENLSTGLVSMAAALTEMTAQLRTEVGSAISVYWDKVRLISDKAIFIYDLPTQPSEFYTISEIWIESSIEGQYDYLLPGNQWDIQRGTTNRLVLPTSLTPDRAIKIIGQTKASVTRESKDNFVISHALWSLQMQDTGSKEAVEKAAMYQRETNRLRQVMAMEKAELLAKWSGHTRAYPDSVQVQPR